MKNINFVMIMLAAAGSFQCSQKPVSANPSAVVEPGPTPVQVGAARLDVLLPMLQHKTVALVVNHTSLVGETHLADTLMASGVNVRNVFAPEHGFRGAAADGETIHDGTDKRTGLKIISLYGSNKKPAPAQLEGTDVVIFDIQDVGTRFYTYISTMHYVMQACAEQGIKVIILDRPNPNGDFIDGPLLDTALRSFVGMHPIPIVHGLTVGELAGMINGEGWLGNGLVCDVEVVKLKNWTHQQPYALPVKPSPNLPNDQAVQLYPSLCLFEGTVISVGRGTQMPFLVIGNPEFRDMPFRFTPVAIPGMSNNPPHEGKVCYGLDLRTAAVPARINLEHLLAFYKKYPDKEKFFTRYFNTLAGTPALQQQIKDGWTEDQIRASWKQGLETFAALRSRYLLYP